MGQFVSVGKVTDIEPGTCVPVEVGDRWIALFNVDGAIYAMDNTCPHAGGPLGEGLLINDVVKCPWHGWKFNVRTGQRPDNPEFTVACYEVRVVHDEVQVALPDD